MTADGPGPPDCDRDAPADGPPASDGGSNTPDDPEDVRNHRDSGGAVNRSQFSASVGRIARRVRSPDGTYRGLLGAFPYTLRKSDSMLLKSYVVVGGLVAFGVATMFGISLIVLLGDTASAAGGTFTFSRAFVVFLGLLVVAPLVAPVLFAAYRHRLGSGNRAFDVRMAGLGYLFLCSLYVGIVISMPPAYQDPVDGVAGPLVGVLYALPAIAALGPPLAVTVVIWLVGTGRIRTPAGPGEPPGEERR